MSQIMQTTQQICEQQILTVSTPDVHKMKRTHNKTVNNTSIWRGQHVNTNDKTRSKHPHIQTNPSSK